MRCLKESSVEYRNRTRQGLFKSVVRLASSLDLYGPLARISRRFVTEISPDGSEKRAAAGNVSNDITVVFLDRARFRGDVEILAMQPGIRCLSLSPTFQRFLLGSFVREPTQDEWTSHTETPGIRYEFRSAPAGSVIGRNRAKYREFLQRFVPVLFEQFGVDLVVNSDERYRRHADLTWIADKMGFPHVCLHREALFTVPATYRDAVDRHRWFGRFNGSKILVQNEITRQVLLEAGYATPDQLQIVGCLRMDGHLQRFLNEDRKARSPNVRPRVLMFAWGPGRRLSDGTYFDLTAAGQATIRALTRFAKRHPEAEVIVKIKDIHAKGAGGGLLSVLKRALLDEVDTLDAVPNISFSTERMAAADLIEWSTVVCAMQSTAVLEAAVAGRPVILPHFRSLREQVRAEEVLMFQEQRHLFDVPEDEQDLERLVELRCKVPVVPPETEKELSGLFDRLVSPLAADATHNCLSAFRELARGGREKREAIGNGRRLESPLARPMVSGTEQQIQRPPQ